jgi:chromate transporter
MAYREGMRDLLICSKEIVMFATLLRLLWSFSKIGMLGFGGGPSFIPLIQKEVVDVNSWLTEEEFVDALAMGNILPGPIATKMAVYTGYKLAQWPGAVIGVLGTVGPSAILMIVMALFFFTYKDHPKGQALLKAVRPAIVALLAFTAYDIFPQSVKGWDTGIIAVAAFAAIAFLDVHPALVILAAASLGIVVY